MIKEKKKPKLKKSFAAIAMEYLKTIAISFSAALIFTLLLSFHARSEMIKNLYINADEQQKMDEKVAKQMPNRTTRQCREHWNYYLNPNINKDPWTSEEEALLLEKQGEFGNKWSQISKFFKKEQ